MDTSEILRKEMTDVPVGARVIFLAQKNITNDFEVIEIMQVLPPKVVVLRSHDIVDGTLSEFEEVTVKWFSPYKGFGFFTCERQKEDILLHMTTLHRSRIETLTEGMKVWARYGVNSKTNRLMADEVSLVKPT